MSAVGGLSQPIDSLQQLSADFLDEEARLPYEFRLNIFHESYAFRKRVLEKRFFSLRSDTFCINSDRDFWFKNFNAQMYNEFGSLAFDDYLYDAPATGSTGRFVLWYFFCDEAVRRYCSGSWPERIHAG